MSTNITPTGNERFLIDDQLIVSKTDLQGKITYVNQTFLEISGYVESEVLTKPHSILRHPEMPRSVFKLLWDTIQSGQEVFAYVVNLAKKGDHYWVFAHVTPSYSNEGTLVGYHSNRRAPDRKAVSKAEELYRILLEEEKRHSDPRKGLLASYQMLGDLLEQQNTKYEEFVFSL